MKKNNIKLAWLCMVTLIVLVSCKKSEYLTDEGVHNPVTPLSNYDYLKQHSWNSFDTLVTIIDRYNLKEEVNKAGTFFAPTDYSIARFLKYKLDSVRLINENNKYTLDSLYKQITADSIRQYLFAEKIALDDAAIGVTPFTSLGKTTCAVQKFLQTNTSYSQWGSTPVYSLYYIKVRGTIDDPNSTPVPTDPNTDSKVISQTTGIQTSSGSTLLHVLSNTHVFVRF